MKMPPVEDVAARMRLLGHTVFTGAENPTVVSIRGLDRRAGRFDDVHGVMAHDARGRLRWVVTGAGTTDASPDYLTGARKGNAAGTAIALPGQHRGCWAVGPQYRGNRAHPYPCFRQVAPIAFIRDDDGDAVLDVATSGYCDGPGALGIYYETIERQYGIHHEIIYLDMHRTVARGPLPTQVGPFSAACAVWLDPGEYGEALDFCTRAVPAYGSRVSWCLLDQWWGLLPGTSTSGAAPTWHDA